MLLKKKNIVVEVPENKVEEYKQQGYNEYKKAENDKTSRNKRKKL